MSKKRIIDEAAQLFVMYGVKATTMDDIAKHMGISKRTIYEHFKDKTDLIETVIEETHQKSMAEEKAIFEQTKNVLEAFLRLSEAKKSAFSVKLMKTVIEIKHYYPEILNKRMKEHKGIEILRTIFEKGIEQGVFRPDMNPKTSAFLLSEQGRLFFTEQLQKIELSTMDSFDISSLQFIEDLFFNFLRGISTTKGIEIIEKYKP